MAAYIVITDPQDDRTKKVASLLAHNRVRTTPVERLDDILKVLPANERSLVIVPDFVGDATNIVDFSQAARGRAFVIYISDTVSADTYKQFSKSGAGEWIRWSSLAEEIPDVLRQHASGPARANGAIIAFLPSAGGVGNSTLALETAIHLASRGKGKRSTCVLDLNFQSSGFPTNLDIEPRFDIAEILADPSRLDQHLVDVLTSKHSSGVDVFASPPQRFDYGKLDSTILFAILDEISRRYDVVHLDLPTVWFPWMENLLLGSDRILVTGTYNIPSVKRLATKMQYLESLNVAGDHIAAIINHAESGLFGGGVVRRSDVISALSGVKVLFIRRDDKAALEATNAGRTIAQSGGGRGLKKDMKQVGEWIDKAQQDRTTAGLKTAA
jgi:pilus assembly protein CpaE